MEHKIKLCRITTVPLSLYLLLEGQLEYMQENGFEVTALSSPGEFLDRIRDERNIRTLAVPISRPISVLSDIVSLFRLYRVFRRERFDIVHTQSYKAGLLGMMAALAAGVPVRLHSFAGTPSEYMKSLKWKIVQFTDKVTAACATHCLVNSRSQRELLLQRNTARPEKLEVLLEGSTNGVDLARFTPTEQSAEKGRRTRTEFNIPEGAKVVLFVGRLVGDKGVNELVRAFNKLEQELEDLYLLLVGPREEELDPLSTETAREIESNPRIIETGFREDVESFFAASTILAVPSYREGFPNVFVQAAAMMVPVVGTRITGVVDAVRDGENGILVPAGDHESLAGAMSRLLSDPGLCEKMGRAGRRFVEDNYERTRVWSAVRSVYLSQYESRVRGG